MDAHDVIVRLQLLQDDRIAPKVRIHTVVTGYVVDVDLEANPGAPLYATLSVQGSEREAPRLVQIPVEIITGLEEL